MQQFKKETLDRVGEVGSKKVAEAFTILAKVPVTVKTSRAETIPLSEAEQYLLPKTDHAVVVYSQVLAGLPIHGVSFLTLDRGDALTLVDILNQQAIGTTAILKDIDRSAIKETLNILSNAYLNALAEIAEVELGLGAPIMITSSRLKDIVEMSMKKQAEANDTAVVFETTLATEDLSVKANLFLLFSEELYKASVESVA
jgi:chemotaxis protein CheY-P-specific phosphatase CheC